MAIVLEYAAIRSFIEGCSKLYEKYNKKRLTAKTKKDLQKILMQLLMAPSDLSTIEAKLQEIRAAGIINADLFHAEEWLAKHQAGEKKKAAKRKTAKKMAPKRKVAKRKTAKKMAPKRKAAKKKASKRKVAKR